jgi:hypothetical protein
MIDFFTQHFWNEDFAYAMAATAVPTLVMGGILIYLLYREKQG